MSNTNGQTDASLNHTAWLIELPQHARYGEPPTYWGHVEDGEGWTRDVNEAFQFNTETGADRHGSDVGILDYEVLEHAWEVPGAV